MIGTEESNGQGSRQTVLGASSMTLIKWTPLRRSISGDQTSLSTSGNFYRQTANTFIDISMDRWHSAEWCWNVCLRSSAVAMTRWWIVPSEIAMTAFVRSLQSKQRLPKNGTDFEANLRLFVLKANDNFRSAFKSSLTLILFNLSYRFRNCLTFPRHFVGVYFIRRTSAIYSAGLNRPADQQHPLLCTRVRSTFRAN
jgi:hypothetical protein